MMKLYITTKRLFYILFLFFQASFIGLSQNAKDYVFSQYSGTYTPLINGTVIPTSNTDDNVYQINLPIPFTYLGVPRTSFNVNTNGLIGFSNSLGVNPLGGTNINYRSVPLSSLAGVISPFGVDLVGLSTSTITHSLEGDEYIVQWNNFRRLNVPSDQINFQVRLNTLTGEIKFVYNTGTPDGGGGRDLWVYVAIQGDSPSDSQSRCVDTSTSWLSSVEGTSTCGVCYFTPATYGSYPEEGKTYVYTAPSCISPANVRVSDVGTTEVTVEWDRSPLSTSNDYEYFLSNNATPPTSEDAATGSVSGSQLQLANLNLTTNYFIWIRSVCNNNQTSAWSKVTSILTNHIPATIPFNEDFEGVSEFAFISDRQTNKWFLGSVAGNPGKSIYISNGNGTTNDYTNFYRSRSFAYRDFSIPTGTEIIQLSFDWRCKGGYNPDAYLKVWLVPTNYLPSVETPISANIGKQIGAVFMGKTTWQNFMLDTLDVTSFLTQDFRLVFEWKNDSSYPLEFILAAAIDNIQILAPSCPKPFSSTVSLITSNSARISYNTPVHLPSLGYEYYISTTPTEPTALSTPNKTSAIPELNLTNLEPSTKYYIWARSRCSSQEVSVWSSMNYLLTDCENSTPIPWLENFDQFNIVDSSQINGIVDCWVGYNDVGVANNSMSYIDSRSGENVLAFRIPYRNIQWAFTPNFDLQAGQRYRLSFYYRTEIPQIDDPIRVYIGQGKIATAMHQILESELRTNSDTTFRLFRTDFTVNADGLYNFGITINDFTPIYLMIDDVKLDFTPTCLSPRDLISQVMSPFTAELTWTVPAHAPPMGYEYYLSTINAAPTDTTTISGTSANQTVIIDNLTPNSTYFVWVRSVCSATEKSEWIFNGVHFSTPCEPANLPYEINFDGIPSTSLPACTKVIQAGRGNVWKTTGNSLSYSYSRTESANSWFFTQGINLTGGVSHRISYRCKASMSGLSEKMRVSYGLSPTVNGMENNLQDHTNINNTNFLQNPEVIDFTPLTSGVYYFGFQVYSEANKLILYLDDILIELTPTCFPVTDLTTSLVGNESATVSWTPSTLMPAVGFEYYLSTSLNSPGHSTVATGSTLSTLLELNNLIPGTNYYIWVRSICSQTDKSYWSVVHDFITKQDPVDLPYIEDFETNKGFTLINGQQITHWNHGDALNTTSKSLFTTINLDRPNGAPAPSTTKSFAYKEFNISADALQGEITFDCKIYNQNSSDTLNLYFVPGGYLPAPGNNIPLGNRVPIGTNLRQSSDWTTFVFNGIDLAPYAGTTVGVVFEWVLQNPHRTYANVALDNFSFKKTTCFPISNLNVSQVTNETANISWDPPALAPVSEFEYYLSTSTNAPNSSTVPTGTVSTTSFVLNNLIPGTNYYIWIRSKCSQTDKSIWSSLKYFITKQPPVDLPYEEDFEIDKGFILINGVQDYIWKHGVLSGESDNKMYILYPNNISGGISRVYAYKEFNVTAGVTRGILKFDAKTNYVNIPRVLLVPGSDMPSPGNAIQTGAGVSIVRNLPYFTEWTTFTDEVNLAPYAGSTVGLIFEYFNSGGNLLAIDNVSFKEITCLPAMNLSSSEISSMSAKVTWSASALFASNQYEYYVSTANVAPDETSIPTGFIGATTLRLNNLIPNTNYFIWVRSFCSTTNQSEWSEVHSFQTSCSIESIPYRIDFEDVAISSIPACNLTQSSGIGEVIGTNTDSRNNFLRFSVNDNYSRILWYFTKGVALTAGRSYRISYKYSSSLNYNYKKLRVSYGNSQQSSSMTNVLSHHNQIDVDTFQSTPVFVDFIPASSGVFYFGFEVYDMYTDFYVNVDDILIDYSPCSNPTAVIYGPQGRCVEEIRDPAMVVLTGIAPWNLTFTNGTNQTQVTALSSPYTFNPVLDGDYYIETVSDPTCVGVASGAANFIYTPGAVVQNQQLICEGDDYVINGNRYHQEGIYYDTLVGVDNCDSVVVTTLRLTDFSAEASYSMVTGRLTAREYPNVTYAWIDCDLDFIVSDSSTYSPEFNGSYRLEVKHGSCIKTTTCLAVGNVSTSSLLSSSITVFPNPTLDEVKIRATGEDIEMIDVLDTKGQIIETHAFNSHEATISLGNLSEGVYFLHIFSKGKNVIKKVVKK